ncbi:YtnP family quorum-quenching lactonase [Psychrobacillus lasiicapitis]|uniref:MBL fold metallo-hydrolase n=1 Tax=Psychrobacillus lasiicapitis TaxID=1636719 RepID=A0A544T961_9BACI|nr:MBL fold metallo-hydrolase [Psychrobacillus lasiicapitis]TQR13999.1 MBL fold metallo-hydrolase [Psychrobacillus lasiicapitis]GGA37308.1 putative quorum-quenching lactonase YtnP [Psychrobacillus lasiicapitis]
MDTFQFHDMSLTWLKGGTTHMDGGAMFGVVPKPLWEKKYPVNEKNQIELASDPLFIQHKGQNILLEAGIGYGKFTDKQLRNYGISDQSQVEDNLAQLGVLPEEIDIVIMTHLHFDHACGLTKWVEDRLVSSFPNAKIYVSDVEWNEMKNPNIRSRNTYWKENWEPIEDQVVTFTESIEVVDGIEMIHTGGHSDGHSIVLFKQNDETIIHMADLMPTNAHQNPLWVLAYDDYPMTSVFAKEKWVNEALQSNYWFSFYHDVFYRLVKWSEDGKEIVDKLERTNGF